MKQEETPLLLAVTPADLSQGFRKKTKEIQLLYRMDSNLNLLQAANCPQKALRKGQIMGIHAVTTLPQGDVENFCRQVLGQLERHGYCGLATFFPQSHSALLRQTIQKLEIACQERFLDFYVTEAYGKDSHTAQIFISTALSGGTLEGRFNHVVECYGKHRIVMEIDCMGEDFLLPAPKGSGESLSPQEITALMHRENASVFFSKELCARYFTYQNTENSLRFVLFDDKGTVKEKIANARKWNLSGVCLSYPQVKDWNIF